MRPPSGSAGWSIGKSSRRKPLQDLPGPVDVVDAPAAVPAALGLLGAPEIIEGAGDRGVVGAIAERAEQLEDPRRDVGTARVEHGVVVGERAAW